MTAARARPSSGFYNPNDKNDYSWPVQAGALTYQVVRGNTADFSVGCTIFGPFVPHRLVDAEPVASGDSAGVERTVPCD